MDHRTLEHFGTQCDLSHCQACWMEFMLQYDATIHYLPGKQNLVADALSRLPDSDICNITSIFAASNDQKIRSRFELEDAILEEIKLGYETNQFKQKLATTATGMDNIQQQYGFWFVNNRLVVPAGKHIQETLFHITHDKLGHFGAPKTYEVLHHPFYWPHMH